MLEKLRTAALHELGGSGQVEEARLARAARIDGFECLKVLLIFNTSTSPSCAETRV